MSMKKNSMDSYNSIMNLFQQHGDAAHLIR